MNEQFISTSKGLHNLLESFCQLLLVKLHTFSALYFKKCRALFCFL